jgi:hypothetical protein
MIRINYEINGVTFKRSWPPEERLNAIIRIRVLEDNGVTVTVKGL